MAEWSAQQHYGWWRGARKLLNIVFLLLVDNMRREKPGNRSAA
jgi:hypothetical protein